GPTATAATVDAMASIGQDFDGRWYPGLDDYLLTRWGPEAEDNARLWWWGVLVNRSFPPVGGCQLRVHGGDEVLWVNDAFSGRAFLWLDGPGKAVVGTPFGATVTATAQSTAVADAIGAPYAGAQVAAVTADGRPAPAGVVSAGASGPD